MMNTKSKMIRCSLLIVLPLMIVRQAAADTVIFSDDFGRSDGPVGNGWSNSPDNTTGPLGISGGKLTNTTNTGTSGIFRPISFTTPLRIQAVITETDGSSIVGSRFTSGFSILGDGSFSGGYLLGVGRTHAGFTNSRVTLSDNGVPVGTINSNFQFDSELFVDLTFFHDGRVEGSISEGGNEFLFDFGPHTINSAGGDFTYVQEWNSPSSSLNPTMDDLVITAIPAPSCLLVLCAGFGMNAKRRR